MVDPDFMIAFVLGRISSSPVLEIIKTTVEAENLKGILWQKYKSGLKVVVFIDEIDGETHFAQLGSSWPGEPKMSRK